MLHLLLFNERRSKGAASHPPSPRTKPQRRRRACGPRGGGYCFSGFPSCALSGVRKAAWRNVDFGGRVRKAGWRNFDFGGKGGGRGGRGERGGDEFGYISADTSLVRIYAGKSTPAGKSTLHPNQEPVSRAPRTPKPRRGHEVARAGIGRRGDNGGPALMSLP